MKIHLVSRLDPIPEHGFHQTALCGHVVVNAQPLLIVPDVSLVSVYELAKQQFGGKMCRHCLAVEPKEAYVYFLVSGQELIDLKRMPEYAEAI